jgi:hypothetical protein
LDAQLVANLERIVSAPRLQRYRNASASDLETAVLYCWNVQLGEALMPSIAVFEVTLRNAVHNTLTSHAGTDWWFKSTLYKEAFDNILKIINESIRRNGHPPTIGKLISEITFGFWPKVFASRLDKVWWDTHGNPLIAQLLPHHPNIARDTRSKLEQRLEYFVVLRNRIMHQEAIFDGVQANNRPRLPIDDVHSQLIETLGWIDTDAANVVACVDRFDAVFDPTARQALENDIKARFQIP